MPKLYELAENVRLLAEKLEEMDLDQQVVNDTLEGSTEMMTLEEKVEGIIRMVKNWESDMVGIEAERKRLEAMEKAHKNRIESVKAYLKGSLEAAGLEKVKIGTFTARLQKNSRGSVIVDDLEAVPANYKTFVPGHWEANNDALYQELKTGAEVPGVRYEVGKHLRVG